MNANLANNPHENNPVIETRVPVNSVSLYLLFFFSFFLILAGMVLLVFLYYSGVSVKSINIRGNRYLKESEILSLLSFKQRNFISQDGFGEIEKRLLSHPLIKSVSISLEGNVLILDVEDKSCAAVLIKDSIPIDIFEDLSRHAESVSRCSGVPVLSGFNIAGEVSSDKRTVEILDSLLFMKKKRPALYSKISEIQNYSFDQLRIYLTGSRIRMEVRGNLSDSIQKRMLAAYNYFEREKIQRGTIDLRGSDAILVPER